MQFQQHLPCRNIADEVVNQRHADRVVLRWAEIRRKITVLIRILDIISDCARREAELRDVFFQMLAEQPVILVPVVNARAVVAQQQ